MKSQNKNGKEMGSIFYFTPRPCVCHHVAYRIKTRMLLWLSARYSFGCKNASHPGCRKVGTLSYSIHRTTLYLSSHQHISPKLSIPLLYLVADIIMDLKKINRN